LRLHFVELLRACLTVLRHGRANTIHLRQPVAFELIDFRALIGSQVQLVQHRRILKRTEAAVLRIKLIVPLPLLGVGKDRFHAGGQVLLVSLLQITRSLASLVVGQRRITQLVEALLITAVNILLSLV